MPATLDLNSMRQFTADLNNRLRQCDNGEGMVCSNLDETIRYYVELCRKLRGYINQWTRAVFTAEVRFESEVEILLKTKGRELLRHAKHVAARGRALNEYCFAFESLNELHFCVADLDYLLENWVTPQPAVGPAARVKVPREAAQQIRERLKNLRQQRPTE
jgi:hypothetical protein